MGVLDRLSGLDSDPDEEYGPDDEPVVNHVIAQHLLGLLQPFVPEEDGMATMLLALARRFLADANDAQLREVVVELCKAADSLRPFILEGGTLAIEAHTGPASDAGRPGEDSRPDRAN